MQSPQLDPNRPHGLDDIIFRRNTESPYNRWTPSWADVCRVRAYIGGEWLTGHNNAYDSTSYVLDRLEDVHRARTAIEPYLSVGCEPHNATVGAPCAHTSATWGFHQELPLPKAPLICTWRILAKHDRRRALEIFKSHPPASSSGGRDILSISTELPFQMRGDTRCEFETARVQYRHPQSLIAERLVGVRDWEIHDIRIGGEVRPWPTS